MINLPRVREAQFINKNAMEKLLTIDQLKDYIVQQEAARDESKGPEKSKDNTAAASAYHVPQPGVLCTKCVNKGHYCSECSRKGKMCFQCKRYEASCPCGLSVHRCTAGKDSTRKRTSTKIRISKFFSWWQAWLTK